ncbi:thiamine pyrophosphate-dependent enzyme, partial [Kribbella sp. NPDC050281]|uniref:thiamine pyrophosphate-dependent enzyme n=1 Tax=Kribbella sp. NPDC050281 TaxID=3155515 RepID=UPI0034069AD9
GSSAHRVHVIDPAAVRTAVADAAERARAGEGPALLELMTQRLVGHYIGDAEQYRPPGEIEAARRTEPIVRLGAATGLPVAELDDIRDQAYAEMDAAADAALAAPPADASTAREHLYA